MDPKSAAVKLVKWEQVVIAANNSGMKKKEWCAQNGINEKKFYYWQRKVRCKAIETMKALKTQGALGSGMTSETQALSLTKSQSDFVEVSIHHESASMPGGDTIPAHHASQPEMVLEIGDCKLYIHSGIQEQTLAVVLKAIRHA